MIQEKQKFYIVIIIAVLGNLIFGFGSVSYFVRQIDLSQQAYRDTKEELGNINWRKNQITLLKEIVAQNKEAIEEIEGVFLDPEQDIEFIRSIEDMVRRTSLSHGLTPLSITKGEDGSPIAISAITVTGTYNNVLYFLELLEHMKFNVEVTNISIQKIRTISSSEEGIPEAEVSAKITFFTYIL